MSDVTNAEDLIEQHGEDLHYCYPWRKWLVWAETRWHLDDIGGVMRRCKETVKDLLRRATYVKDELLFSHMMTHAKASLSAQRLSAMATVAQSEEGIPILPEAIDANTWLLNCRNGTVDLKTGTLRPHNRTDYITLCLDVDYDPNAQCPTWERFLLDIMGGNTGLVEFLQRAVGYSITGEVSEQAFLILWGEGENGKSTFINALLHLLGDYAMKAPTELLMMTGQQDRHPTEKADLAGKRFVATIETEENRRLAEVLIKELTGGDKIRARHMREDFWEFWPTHTIWLATNHRPEIRGTDRAIWRRIRLIPFTQFFKGAGDDKHLLDKLKAEVAGILTWAIKGCQNWQKNGLGIPDEVRDATREYQSEMDIVGVFLADECLILPEAQIKASVLYVTYKKWCEKVGEGSMTQTQFGRKLTAQGFQRFRSGVHWWRGVALSQDMDRVDRLDPKVTIASLCEPREESIPTSGANWSNRSNGKTKGIDIMPIKDIDGNEDIARRDTSTCNACGETAYPGIKDSWVCGTCKAQWPYDGEIPLEDLKG